MVIALSATACVSKVAATSFDGGIVVFLNMVSTESTQHLSLLIMSTHVILNDDVVLLTSGVVPISSSCFD